MSHAMTTSVPASEAHVAPSPKGWRARLLRVAVWTGGLALFFTIVMGLLHTKLGRPVLAMIGVGCPVQTGTPEQIDKLRAMSAAPLAGKPKAPARPALGFALDATTRADVDAWAKKHGVTCAPIAGNEHLKACESVPAPAIGQPESFGPAEDVAFEFRASGTLAVVTVVRRKLSVAQANAVTAAVARDLRAALGEPHVHGGENTPAHFAKGPIQAYKDEFTFGDYRALLTESRLADTGIMVREQYFSSL